MLEEKKESSKKLEDKIFIIILNIIEIVNPIYYQ